MQGDTENYYRKLFEKRSVICFIIIIAFFFSCVLRLTVIATKDYAEVQAEQSALKLSAGTARGTIFDCNMIPLTNQKKKIIAAVSPTPRAITGISSILSGDELYSVLERLKDGKPVLCEVERTVECDGISFTTVYEHNSADTKAIHLIGYTDSENHGANGLERAYDEYLYCESDVNFIYTADGLGNVLGGIEPTVENQDFAMANGVVSTIEINIQNIVEENAKNLKSGAIIVCETKSGTIRAMASRPDFDCTNIAKYLSAENSPLMNRVLCAYNVGSIFKPCVAAAGIENGINGYTYNCSGNVKIGDRLFNCHKHSGHGCVTLADAIAFSCNTYFYTLGFLTGATKIYNTASSLQFGREIKICNGISSAAGNLPSIDHLLNPGNLANFSIGQGQLLLSPIAMLNLYNSIASGGTYITPSVVEATIKDGVKKTSSKNSPTRVMSEDTASILRSALGEVIKNGTAAAAEPRLTTAAGKTSTAQTGKYKDGAEINQGWFCGFFPADEPKYTVIVFAEDLSLQEYSCAQIFASIADGITQYESAKK